MIAIEMWRQFYAEEIAATSNVKNPILVEALAEVPRERFLGPGPWTVRGEADFQSQPRQTADADPRRVYHNVAVAIDPRRQLFNGAPSLLAMAIDALELNAGGRVLHVGAGTGYYTAVMARCVGPSGRVLAIEVDEALAGAARANLASIPWVDVRHADGSGALGESFSAILVNAGVTHPLAVWLDALEARGRIVVPLTVPVAPTIGKGLLLMLARTADATALDARVLTFVAIYSAIGVRDETLGRLLGEAMRKQPFPSLKRLRRDRHDATSACWLHAPDFCLSTT